MKIVAIIDGPSSKSYSRHAFFVEHNDIYEIKGMKKPKNVAYNYDEIFNKTIVDPINVDNPKDLDGKVISWVGTHFFSESMRLGCPPNIPQFHYNHFNNIQGCFWIDTPRNSYYEMVRWLKRAAKRVFNGRISKEESNDLAILMIGCLPGSMLSRAAVWYTRDTYSEKQRHLDWYLKLEKDSGRILTKFQLLHKFELIRDTFDGTWSWNQ
jgi:hypothetical protein